MVGQLVSCGLSYSDAVAANDDVRLDATGSGAVGAVDIVVALLVFAAATVAYLGSPCRAAREARLQLLQGMTIILQSVAGPYECLKSVEWPCRGKKRSEKNSLNWLSMRVRPNGCEASKPVSSRSSEARTMQLFLSPDVVYRSRFHRA